MIQVSTHTAATLDLPGKTAGPAAIEGLFASLLGAETGEPAEAGGKILPDTGKVLPEGLPAEVPGMPLALAMSLVTPLTIEPEPAVPTAPAASTLNAGAPALAAPVAAKIVDLAEPVTGELVEPVSVEPVEVTAAEIADTAPRGGDMAEQPLVLALLPQVLQPAVAPSEVEVAAADPFRAPVQDRAVPAERQPAPQGTPATAVPERPPVVALPMGALAAQTPAAKAAEPATERAPGAAREPAQATTGTTTAPPVLELKLALSADRQPAGNGDLSAPRAAAPVHVLPGFEAPAVAAVATDAPAVVAPGRADFAPAAIQPHDLATLVDRLIEARENARPAASATLMHADFGEVSLKFGHDNGNLTVALANSDPGFVRAVNAAVAAEGGSTGQEAAFQGERRDGGQSASTRTAADSQGSSNERGSGRDARDGRSDRSDPQPRANGQAHDRAGRKSLGGIFA
ncbi:MAG: hypothetical protein B7Z08_02125 [Sphingomonadales bacterium 32-68-7]|nr:MAG: hypothetical protein B7Z33_10425 [Sphingomonadales bacterium 12-68-11]OYX10175.1 MAG: hypothetical protein B7Z08_02125 [Sphingomonadales bacterium 32-68-7]